MSIGLPEDTDDQPNPLASERASILVVDEDPAFQLGLKTFLREYVGFAQVFTARSGPEAVERILEDDSIDVVTLDYQMPGMDGIEVLEELREKLEHPVSVLMVTGYPSEDLEARYRSFDSPTLLTRHFLSKPVEFEKIEPIILRAQGEVRAAREIERTEAVEEAAARMKSDPRFVSMRERLDRQEERLEALETRVRTMQGRWRKDFFGALFIAALLFALWRFDWIDRLQPIGEKLVEDVRVFLAPPESGDDPVEATEDTDEPLNEGRPL